MKPHHSKVHLEKWLALQTGLARRDIYELFKAKRIRVNGNPPSSLTLLISPKADTIHVDAQKIEPQDVALVYYKFHKPGDVLTTMEDPLGRRTVSDFMQGLHPSVFPVGRLDRHTTGLLLLTNDGQWANELMHPKHQVSKQYAVTVDRSVSKNHLDRLVSGMMLEDGPFQFSKVVLTDKQHLLVSLDEGRNRIVRRAFEALGYQVKKLHRLSIGGIQLGNLPVGQIKPLNKSELLSL